MGLLSSIGGLAGLGTAIGGIGAFQSPFLGYSATQRANRMQFASAREQMQFQKMMSDTSYQRAVKDMRKAGINPLLAVSKGGASTPAGAQAQVKDPGPTLASSALSLRRLQEDLKNLQAQRDNLKADTELKGSQVELTTEQAKKVSQDVKLSFQQTMKAFEERNLTRQKVLTEKFVTKYQQFAANEKNYVQQELKMILDMLQGPDGEQILKQRAFKGTGMWATLHALLTHYNRKTAVNVLKDFIDAIDKPSGSDFGQGFMPKTREKLLDKLFP